MPQNRRVLHATDFSSASRAAFAKALELAKASRGELLLVHVLAPVVPMAADTYVPPETYAQIEKSTRAAAERQMAALAGRARKAGVRAQAVITEGTAADQIVRLARSKHADVVVVGTHGRTGLARFFLGSVAGRVVSTSPVPVLTVRGK
jgi:nucleotide-binding universal stress UspA family protein